jgi:SAM-dependent methyltransferase
MSQSGWEDRQQVLEMLRGYRQAQLLITCAELGVFQALGDGPASADALGHRVGANPDALTRLLNAACAIGLLEKRGELYANSPLATACLAAEGPFYLGNLVQREGAFYRRWSHLTEAVRSGRRPEENVQDEGVTNWVRAFELALYDVARTAAPAVAEALGPLLPARAGRPPRVIDVGGGHGAYSIALARRYPTLEAEVFELPAAAEVAREIIASSGVADRVSVRAGDFKRDELGAGFDLALLFGILVSEPPPDALALLRKVYDALAPGGLLAIRGWYLNPDRTGPLDAALADVHMLLSTDAGAAYTLDDVVGWVGAAGFPPPDHVALPPPERSSLLVSRKPA